jgi:glycine dehydrogenase subunit 2
VGVGPALVDYLPCPLVAKEDGRYVWQTPACSIGRMKTFSGNFGVLVRAYTYMRMYGSGLRAVSENAVLNANYLQARVKKTYPVPHGDRLCMHEFVAQGIIDGAPQIHTLDIAKRLIDFGMHPPTIYFPLIVPEALMIEPTETESLETLDRFVAAMEQIAEEARSNPEIILSAPHDTPVSRLDEVRAARMPVLCAGSGCLLE